MMDTICRDCVFADWTNDEDRKFQSGCLLNLLEKYQKLTEFELVDDKDTNKSYFKIKNRLCIGCRNQDWAKKQGNVNKIEAVKKEWQITWTALVFFNQNHSQWDLDATIDSINALKNPPIKTIFVCRNFDVRPSVMVAKAKTLKTRWNVEFPTSDAPIEEHIDLVFKKTEGLYYSVYSGGYALYDIVESLYEKLRNSLAQIVVVEPDLDNNGLMILRKIHKFLNGNKEQPLQDKIRTIAKEQECENLIVPIQSLV